MYVMKSLSRAPACKRIRAGKWRPLLHCHRVAACILDAQADRGPVHDLSLHFPEQVQVNVLAGLEISLAQAVAEQLDAAPAMFDRDVWSHCLAGQRRRRLNR